MYHKHIIAVAAALIALSNPTSAARTADLITYVNSDCTGPLLGCTNYPPSTCCGQTAHPKYKGHKCNGCRPNDTHGVYKGTNANKACTTACNAASGSRCAACPAPVSGAAWFARAKKRELPSSTEKEEAFEIRDIPLPSCTATVDPDIFSKDHITYFKVYHDVPQEMTDTILAWGMDPNSTLADLPDEAFKYEIPNFRGFSFD